MQGHTPHLFVSQITSDLDREARRLNQVRHHWTDAQIQYLIDHADASIAELVRGFRATFHRWAADLTDNAIKNRRYHLVHPETGRSQRRRRQARKLFPFAASVAVAT